MKWFVAVIGSRNSGKSSVIKSLTGCPHNSFRGFVKDNLNGASIYVSCGSPQEQTVDLETLEELSEILETVTSTELCRGIVMAIQPSNPSVRLSMEEILTEALAKSFTVAAYVLDPEYDGSIGTFAIVTPRLSPLGVSPVKLDARRFAHISSTTINAATKIAA